MRRVADRNVGNRMQEDRDRRLRLYKKDVDLDMHQMLVSSLLQNRPVVFHDCDGDTHALFIVGNGDNIMSTASDRISHPHLIGSRSNKQLYFQVRVQPVEDNDVEALRWTKIYFNNYDDLIVQWPIETTPEGWSEKVTPLPPRISHPPPEVFIETVLEQVGHQ